MGRDADHRTDIWAVCVIIYEAISGSMPFAGANFGQLLESITRRSPTPLTDLGVADAELWALIAKGLDRDPSLRWQSMAELGAAMAQWLLQRGVLDDVTGASLASCWLRAPGHFPLFSSAPPGADLARYELPTRNGAVEITHRPNDVARVPKRHLRWIGLGLFVVAAASAAWAMMSGPVDSATADGPPSDRAVRPANDQTQAPTKNAISPIRQDAPGTGEPPVSTVATTARPGAGEPVAGNSPSLEPNPPVDPEIPKARQAAPTFTPTRLKDPFR
jgi:serine/threonine protein kinase